jgi:hypothetical protein
VQFNILDASDPHRFKVSREGQGDGWTLQDTFWAMESAPASGGAVLFNILDAGDPHRFKVSREDAGLGWALQDSFWAYEEDPGGGAIQFNILDADDPHRFKVSREGAGAGWALQDSFWAYESQPGAAGDAVGGSADCSQCWLMTGDGPPPTGGAHWEAQYKDAMCYVRSQACVAKSQIVRELPYFSITTGTCADQGGDWVTTMEECEAAANSVSFAFESANTYTCEADAAVCDDNRPTGCVKEGNAISLFPDSTGECSSSFPDADVPAAEISCLCKRTVAAAGLRLEAVLAVTAPMAEAGKSAGVWWQSTHMWLACAGVVAGVGMLAIKSIVRGRRDAALPMDQLRDHIGWNPNRLSSLFVQGQIQRWEPQREQQERQVMSLMSSLSPRGSSLL